jgi:hypothetical protein
MYNQATQNATHTFRGQSTHAQQQLYRKPCSQAHAKEEVESAVEEAMEEVVC